jgi:NADPH-dependent 2,4-dienoyl-CoA reductase/sulfur reductase-like enzyme
MIGSGIAALSAAETIRQHEPDAAITMISEEAHDFYSRPGLAYFLRGDLPEKQLFLRGGDEARRIGVERVLGRAERIDVANHRVQLADGGALAYDRLLLATGSRSAPPPFPGADLDGIVTLDCLDDARRIIKLARRGKTAVVVGGGITALELAEGLACRGMKVHYLLRGERYWADVLDETESDIVQDRLRHHGIDIRTETQVREAVGIKGRLTAIETQDGVRLPCDVLAVAIGVRPRLELAKQAGLKLERGIIVDDHLRTSAADVFAAGDCAQVFDPTSGKATLDVLWSTALAQGRVAGANMAGVDHAYRKAVSCNITMLAGLRVSILGAVAGNREGGKDKDLVSLARGDSEAWRVVTEARILAHRDDVNRIRLVIGDRRLLGALVMGDQTWARPLQRLIIAQADITPIHDVLVAGGPEALTSLAEYYHRWDERHPR